MSGIGLPPPPSDDPDLVTIRFADTHYGPWESVSITRSCETMPNAFALTGAADFLLGPALAKTQPGQPCEIFAGQDLLITGWLDRRTVRTDAGSHQITFMGRGITRNLVDCSADLYRDPGLTGGFINAGSLLDLATRLCKSFNITARSAITDPGGPIPAFQIGLGETPYQIIESAARFVGRMVYEDPNGNLVLDQIGTKSMASGFAMPGNIEAINADRSVDGRFSHYIVVWNPVAGLTQLGNKSNFRAEVIDQPMLNTEYRPKIMVSAQILPGQNFGLTMANWEMARRIGRSQAAQITSDGWRDSAGALWTPNMLAPIEAPAADITGANWIIGTVVFRKDLSGTHADLILMPPEAFQPEPNPLNLFDAQLVSIPPGSQTPAPLEPPT